MGEKDKKKDKRLGVHQGYDEEEDHGGGIAIPDSSMPLDDDVGEDQENVIMGRAGMKGNKKANGAFAGLSVEDDEDDNNGGDDVKNDLDLKPKDKRKGAAPATMESKPKKKPEAQASSSGSDSDDVKIDLDLKPKKKAAPSVAKKQQASGLGSDSDSDDEVKIDLDFKPKKKGTAAPLATAKGKETNSKDKDNKKNVLEGLKSLAIEDSDEDTSTTVSKPAAKAKKGKGAGASANSSSQQQPYDDMISFGDSDHDDEEHDDKAKGNGKSSAKDKKKDKGKEKKAVAVAADTSKYEMERQRGAAALKIEQDKQKARQEEEEIDALLAELDDKPTASAAAGAKSKKSKKKRKEAKDEEEDVEALLAALDARDVAGPDGGTDEKERKLAKAGDTKAAKANTMKTARKDHDDNDEEDVGEQDVPRSKARATNNMMNLLAIEGEDNDMNIDVDEAVDADDADDADTKNSESHVKPATAVEKPMTAAEKKKAKKKKGKVGDKQEDDLDAILAEFGVAAPPAPASEMTAAPAAAAVEEGGAESLEQLEAIAENKLTAAQKKRLKKLRQKAKQDANNAPAAPSAATAAAAVPAAESTDSVNPDAVGAGGAGGGKKKESAAVRKMREEIERRKAEQEKLATAAAEAERLAQEQIKAEEEAARRAEEIKQQKKEAERLKREQLRKDGKLLTKSEKEKQRKAEQFRMQLIEQGKLPVGDGTEEKKKVVYESKKKKPRQAGAAGQETAVSGAESAVKVEQPVAVQERSVEVAEPVIESTKEEHADAWDDEDWESKAQALVSVVKKTGDEEEEDINALLAKKAEEHLNSVITEKNEESAQPVRPAGQPSAKPALSKTQLKKEVPIAPKVKVEQESSEEEASGEDEEEESDGSSDEGSESELGSESESDSEETSSEDSSSEYSSSEEDEVLDKQELERRARVAAIKEKRMDMKEVALKARTKDKLRAPIVCILGHVDTGKTKILDRLRRTNVQGGEAGGITQQIGATFFPLDAIRKEVDRLNIKDFTLRIPSLLIIDTPGHESFNNLRTRGSSLCDIAILVVDIMHGLEPQTIESINILRQRKNPFVVALNKIDRLFDWKSGNDCGSRESLSKQKQHVLAEFKDRLNQVKLAFAEQGLNTSLYWENPDPRKFISLVPTSAVTGEGVPDLIMNLVNLSQTMLEPRLMFCNYLECTVIEVKVIEGYGTTVDVVLTGGELKEGDTIVVCGLDGPIVTKIRSLLTPHPMKEMRVKGQYLLHKRLEAAIGIKIAAEGLEKAVAGTQIYVPMKATDPDEIDFLKKEVMSDMHTILSSVDKTGLGVYVQASTLGSLEALLEFLRVSKIPVSGVNIGPVNRRDVMKCSTMLEKKKEFALILAFDVKIEKDAETLAKELEIKIFTADIIYHLFDQFTAYIDDIKKKKREAASAEAVFPCILKILPNCIFNQKSPIVLGVEVQEGILKVGTPIVILTGKTGISAASATEDVVPGMASTVGTLEIGRVQGIEVDKKAVPSAKAGQSVAVKIGGQDHILYGRHFDLENTLYSKLTRRSIDLLKEHFRDELAKEDWQTVIKLKKLLDIK